MAVFTLNMMVIALELALEMPVYEDIASKFFEHFLLIADAMNKIGGEEDRGLWDDQDGFYYDYLHVAGTVIPLRIRSLVGLIPLVAVETFDGTIREKLPNLGKKIEWYARNRPDLIGNIAEMNLGGVGIHHILSVVDRRRLELLLHRMLDESEFLSPFGIRSLSREHAQHPYSLWLQGREYRIDYEPAESSTGLFGGNSNWRGPIWFPINYLIIEALQKFHYFYGDDVKIEMPAGSGNFLTLWEVSMELSHRLMRLFTRDADGRRAVFGGNETFQRNSLWRDYIPFYEYFHGDNGAGLGASHQTGWTALVAKLIAQHGEYCGQRQTSVRLRHDHLRTRGLRKSRRSRAARVARDERLRRICLGHDRRNADPALPRTAGCRAKAAAAAHAARRETRRVRYVSRNRVQPRGQSLERRVHCSHAASN